jgi:Peptidase A4 family
MKTIIFPAPPRDFDPTMASASDLAKFGVPRRPDPDTEPALRKLWDQVFAPKPTFIAAELTENQKPLSSQRNPGKKPKFGLAGQWAGSQVTVSSLGFSPAEPATFVGANIKVPTVKSTPAEPGTQIVGFWVGMGGGMESMPDAPGVPLVQAGVAAAIKDGKEPALYFAWYEWVPKGGGGSSTMIKNFEIKAGDEIQVIVCALKKNLVQVVMVNRRTNKAVNPTIHSPDKEPYDGSTVEWCAEAPYKEMPNFGTVKFTACTAATQIHVIDLSSAVRFNARNPDNLNKLATATVPSNHEVDVTWTAAD